MGNVKPYPREVRERAVRMVLEHGHEYGSQWAAIRSIAEKFGMTAETLRLWVRQVEVDDGKRPGMTSAEVERIGELERENRELRRANEDTTHCPLRRSSREGAGGTSASSVGGAISGGAGVLASPWRAAPSVGVA
jgi:transposase